MLKFGKVTSNLRNPVTHCEIGNKHMSFQKLEIYDYLLYTSKLPEISEHRNLGHDLLYSSTEAT